jgi:hypothetical protein
MRRLFQTGRNAQMAGKFGVCVTVPPIRHAIPIDNPTLTRHCIIGCVSRSERQESARFAKILQCCEEQISQQRPKPSRTALVLNGVCDSGKRGFFQQLQKRGLVKRSPKASLGIFQTFVACVRQNMENGLSTA